MTDASVKWGLNLDKISYGVAALLGLIFLGIAFFWSDGTKESNTLFATSEALTKHIESNSTFPPPPKLDLAAKIDAQWKVGNSASDDPLWITEVPPKVVLSVAKPVGTPPVHEACSITEIACQRDAEKLQAVLVVRGSTSEKNYGIQVRKLEVLRLEEGQDYRSVGQVEPPAEPGAAFEYADASVEPGKAYTYKIRTLAQRDPAAGEHIKQSFEDPREATRESEPLGPTPAVPADFSCEVINFDPNSPAFFGKASYWDYEKGAAQTTRAAQRFAEKDVLGGRFEFFQVVEPTGQVTVRDTKKMARYRFKAGDKLSSVEAWSPFTPGGSAASGGAEAPPEVAPPPAEEEQPKKKPVKATATESGAKKPASKKSTSTKSTSTKKSSSKPKLK